MELRRNCLDDATSDGGDGRSDLNEAALLHCLAAASPRRESRAPASSERVRVQKWRKVMVLC